FAMDGKGPESCRDKRTAKCAFKTSEKDGDGGSIVEKVSCGCINFLFTNLSIR
ncbi:hypothetical protein OS493_038979, partial [Desmophyllum pertusum]